MTAIADLSDLVNRMTGGNSGTPENLWFYKAPLVGGVAPTAPVSGRPCSLWRFDGCPSGGAAPTTVAVPDNTTPGGLQQADPGGGREKWLVSLGLTTLAQGTWILYDRLLHIGSLSGTTITAQTVGGSITRYTDGLGNIVFVEIYTTIGVTSRTITMSYTDEAGNAGNTSPAVAIGNTGFREDTRAIFLPVASGDKGVQAVASVTLSASTGTAGNFGVVVAHPLAVVSVGASGDYAVRDFTTGLPGLPEIQTDACLAWLFIPQSTTIPDCFGAISTVEA